MKIHYAQCWEDSQVLRAALQISRDDDVVSIASGGDNSFALLLDSPRSLTAIDMNPVQIHLVELKMQAIQKLDYNDFIGFIGARTCRSRLQLYSRLRPYLNPKAREYWDSQPDALRRGIIHCGKFERYFSLFRKCVLPMIHSKKTIRKLLSASSLEEQQNLYEKVWNSRRWRLLFRLFFSKFLLGHLGRRPSYFRYVSVENVADELLKRTRRGFSEIPIQSNPFIEYILTGQYRDLERSHPYLQKSNFLRLKENLGRMRLFCGSLDEYLHGLKPGSVSKFNLSDVFEYMSENDFEKIVREIERVSRSDAKLAFWTLLVPRAVPASLKDRVEQNKYVSEKLFGTDRTFFYGSFELWRVNRKETPRKPIAGSVDYLRVEVKR
jgi:S-adenosylmethionine-diacylglycerol 3-amino-3-carboxypropyl transferase